MIYSKNADMFRQIIIPSEAKQHSSSTLSMFTFLVNFNNSICVVSNISKTFLTWNRINPTSKLV